MLDRIAGIALTALGALLIVLLVIGLLVSCRRTSADPPPPTATPFVDFATATSFPGPDSTLPPITTPSPVVNLTPSATIETGPTPPAATADPNATPAPEATVDPGATTPPDAAVPGATEQAVQPVPTQPGGVGGGLTPGSTVNHVVSRGEWLLQIARCYGASYESIRMANTLADPDFILPGWVIRVPAIGSQGAIVGPPCVVAHTATAADTWPSLAQRYGTTPAILQRANPGPLTVGRSIWVPRVP